MKGSIQKEQSPLWVPSAERIANSQMTRFQKLIENKYTRQFANYQDFHQWSVNYPEEFWQEVWDFCGIAASIKSEIVANGLGQFPGARWFPGSRLNFAENLLQYRDDKIALVSLLENGQRKTLSYSQLYNEVEKLAAALRQQGVKSGDRVAGFMPNVCETVIAMLATSSMGAVWSSCSPDFGINGAKDRLAQIEPRILFATEAYLYGGKTIDCMEKIDALAKDIESIEKVVIVPMLSAVVDLKGKDRYVLYQSFIDSAPPTPLLFEQLPFNHPVYINYSSGTTGVPKCIVHSGGGTLIQHKKELMLHTDIDRDDVLFYFTTCGWMMWNWLISGLSCGCTLVLYDGSPFADEGKLLLDAIDKEGMTVFGTSAKFISSLEKKGVKPIQTHQLKSLKTILSTGSPLSQNNYEYIYRDFKKDVCLASICGGTDIISCFMLGNPNLSVNAGEIQCLGLGMAVEFWDENGKALHGEKGELICTNPFPSAPIGFWNDPDNLKFIESYFNTFPNVWAHGDYGEITEKGGIVIHGRSDAVLNPGGVRIGTAEIYREIEKHPEVLDSVVIGQQWQEDERIILFVILGENECLTEEFVARVKSTIRKNASPRHVPALVLAVKDIPRTISGKTAELAVKNIIDGFPVKNRDALINPESLDCFKKISELY